MVCVEREVRIDYGVVETDTNGRLAAIREKPTSNFTLSTGINVFTGRALRTLPAGHVDMPDFLMRLTADGLDVRCHIVDELWMDLGRVEDLAAANELVANGGL